MIPAIQLAPMEGVLDWVLRELLSDVGGVDRMVTEFVRVTDQLLPEHVFHKYSPELKTGGKTRSGTPVFIQLLGGKPEWLAENAVRAAELGAPGIDLNFGCPAKTVNRHDGGAALLKNPERVFQVTDAVRKAVPSHIPVTVKTRLGFEHKDYHRQIAEAAALAKASHIVVHARTKLEMYQPPAHWHYIKSMSQGLQLPFLANGEIWNVDDYRLCVEASGTSKVALGRGLVRRPTLAHEIRRAMTNQDGLQAIPEFCYVDFLSRFCENTCSHRGEIFTLARAKQLLRYWSQDGEVAHGEWFQTVKLFTRYDQLREFLTELRKEELWQKSKSTLGRTALTASAPKIFSTSAG